MNIETLLIEIKEYGIVNNIPNISEENALFIKNIILSIKARNILEIGTANGYSSIHFASLIQDWGGRITTIELADNAYTAAQINFKKSGLQNIDSLFGDARDIIPTLDTDFDFIFIDGMKKLTKEFLEISLQKIKKGGVIIIDDVIKFRYKMEDLYIYLKENSIPYTIEHVDADDGIMILKF